MDVLNGKSYGESAVINSEVARINVDNLLNSLELVLYLVEYPSRSNYYEEYRDAREMGNHPNAKTLPSIFEKYFSVSLKSFFTFEYDTSSLLDFEEECIKTFSSICYEQIHASYQEILFLWSIQQKTTELV